MSLPTFSQSNYNPSLKRYDEIPLKRQYFELVKSGRKTVEGRINSGPFAKMEAGNFFYFKNGEEKVGCLVTGAIKYKTFREMLSNEGVEKCLPGITSIDEGARIYDGIPGYREKAQRFGVVALQIIKAAPPTNDALPAVIGARAPQLPPPIRRASDLAKKPEANSYALPKDNDSRRDDRYENRASASSSYRSEDRRGREDSYRGNDRYDDRYPSSSRYRDDDRRDREDSYRRNDRYDDRSASSSRYRDDDRRETSYRREDRYDYRAVSSSRYRDDDRRDREDSYRRSDDYDDRQTSSTGSRHRDDDDRRSINSKKRSREEEIPEAQNKIDDSKKRKTEDSPSRESKPEQEGNK